MGNNLGTIAMNVELIDVTPEVAKAWLKASEGRNYRKLDSKRVMLYANSMRRDKWEENGQTIQVNCDGTVLDGQHRLKAVVQSGVTVRFLVVTNVVSDGLHIDRGKSRTVKQHLSKLGLKNASRKASISRLCLIHSVGQWNHVTSNYQIIDDDIVDFAVRNDDRLNDAINLIGSITGIPSTTLSAIAFLGCPPSSFPSFDPTVAWFFEKLVTGSELKEHEPVYLLRSRWLRPSVVKPTTFLWRMLATKAWNATVEGKEMRTLRISLTGPTAEALPKHVLVASGD